jgi:putative membrane-bound dehydrogenase-like protein
MKRLAPFLLLPIAVLAGVVVRAGGEGQQSPEKTLAALEPAPGLELKLWASEPMLSNPTNIAVDERSRVWVLEGVNYRRPQRKLPDARPAGDRIVILEDTDQNGQADKVKVFDQNPQIRVPLGIAVLGNKVYVSQAPDLIVYTKDADDNIVKKEVLLTGFGGVDHDHGLHAVVFGPDGKYYFNQGNTGLDVTDRSGRRMQTQGTGANTRPGPGYFEGTVLRMNGDGTGLEVIGQNFRNPYEVALDSFGNVFQTDNDDDGNAWTRLLYNMEGGNYGFRGPLNKTWLEDRGTHWHMEVPGVAPPVHRIGPGSPCGLMVYEGALFPAAYRGQLFHADAGRRVISMYPLTVDGAGYTARTENVVYGGEDTWSRPTDAAVAPDGAVYIADWYDPGVGGHLMGDPDGSRGRIYRLAPVGNRPQAPRVDLASAVGLTAAFASPNESARYLAHAALTAQGQGAVPLLQGLWRQRDPILKARALWILGGLGDAGSAAVQEALRDRDPRFRILGLRVARLHGANMLTVSKPLLGDPSPQVRREIALMLRDPNPALMLPPYLYKEQVQPPGEWLDAMVQLASQHDGKDRWYLEALNIAARGREEALYARLKNQKAGKSNTAFNQLVWGLRPRTALPDLVTAINDASTPMQERMVALDTLGWMQWPEAARAMESVIIASSTPPALADRAFAIYSHRLASLWTDARTSPALPAVLRKGFAAPGAQAAAVAVADALGDPQYLPDLLNVAKSTAAAPEARSAALDAISAMKDARHAADVQALAESGPVSVRVSAVRATGSLGQPGVETWARGIVLGDAPNEVRAEALRLLARTPAGLTAILDLAEKRSIPAELKTLATNLTNYAAPPATGGRRGGPLSPVTIRLGRGAPPTDPVYVAIRERAAKVLPLPSARSIPSALELEFSYVGKAADGRKLYQADAGCAACHSLGGKKTIGPDLSNIGGKYGRQAMLDHIVNPSDAIGPEYITTMFTLKSGASVQGLVTEEGADRIVVQTAVNESQRLRPSDIASRHQIRVSLMPEGLLSNLSSQQLADLLEFLTTLK